jgi:hypothetical protein
MLLLIITVLGFETTAHSSASAKSKPSIQGSIPVKGKSKLEYSALAKISVQEAIAAAGNATSGRVIEVALDRENGFLVYEIEMIMPNQSRKELLIDAGNGKILLTKDKKISSDDEEDEKDED